MRKHLKFTSLIFKRIHKTIIITLVFKQVTSNLKCTSLSPSQTRVTFFTLVHFYTVILRVRSTNQDKWCQGQCVLGQSFCQIFNRELIYHPESVGRLPSQQKYGPRLHRFGCQCTLCLGSSKSFFSGDIQETQRRLTNRINH